MKPTNIIEPINEPPINYANEPDYDEDALPSCEY